MTLQEIGEAIYGVGWRSRLARDLDWDRSQIWRTEKGKREMTSFELQKIAALIMGKQSALARLQGKVIDQQHRAHKAEQK